MKKRGALTLIFLFVLGAVYAQDTGSPARLMDTAVKTLAGDLNRKLIEEGVQKIVIGQFTYRDFIPSLGTYWTSQLIEELANIPGRSYSILSDGSSGVDLTITGEIVETADSIRVYTRLIRSDTRAVTAVFHSDFPRSEHLIQMLFVGGNADSANLPVLRDAWEPDSMGNPLAYEIGQDESVQPANRTIHNSQDQDFFLLVPQSNGRLVMETIGSMDTRMEFLTADTGGPLAEDDDGGCSTNARIRHRVQAGHRYIALVRGYGSSDTGNYGFRAYFQDETTLGLDQNEPDDEYSSAKLMVIGEPQQHTFHDGDDVDWVKFQVNHEGRYVIRAGGINSNDLDTHIELFDANINSIDEDDDGGTSYDSRLSLRLDSGLYYLKVRCLDDEPEEPYLIRIDAS